MFQLVPDTSIWIALIVQVISDTWAFQRRSIKLHIAYLIWDLQIYLIHNGLI